jgi:hypothetical protein
MIGFRSPYLETSTNVRQTLFINTDIQWESTYNIGPGDHLWRDGSNVWPFTLDSGNVLKNKTTIANETYPGKWEIPLIAMTLNNLVFTMNPGEYANSSAPGGETSAPGGETFVSDQDMMNVLMKNFQDSYIGNRSPFGIHFHTPWLSTPGYVKVLNDFIQYASTLNDVRFVTISQFIAWMKNPMNIEQIPVVDHAKCVDLVNPPPAPPTPGPNPTPSDSNNEKSNWKKNEGIYITLIVILGPMSLVILFMSIATIARMFK